MTVTLNPAGLHAFFSGPQMERILIPRAEAVTEAATENASHSGDTTLGIDTTDLHSSIRFEIRRGPDGLFATVGTDVTHRGFNYPAYWDRNGRPWLFSALQRFFPDAVRT